MRHQYLDSILFDTLSRIEKLGDRIRLSNLASVNKPIPENAELKAVFAYGERQLVDIIEKQVNTIAKIVRMDFLQYEYANQVSLHEKLELKHSQDTDATFYQEVKKQKNILLDEIKKIKVTITKLKKIYSNLETEQKVVKKIYTNTVSMVKSEERHPLEESSIDQSIHIETKELQEKILKLCNQLEDLEQVNKELETETEGYINTISSIRTPDIL